MGGFLDGAIAESFLLIIVSLLAAFGNISMFIIVFNNKQLRSISNYYVLSLATADLLVVLVSGPVTVTTMLTREWYFGDTACTIFGFITLLSFVSSVNNLATIALNRYFFIVRWQNYKRIFSKRRAFLYGVITWVISVLLSVLPLLGWSKFAYIPEKSYCFVEWKSDVYYMYFMVIICFGGPLTVMMISYYKILTFTRNLKQRLFHPKNVDKSQTVSKRKVFLRRREARIVSPEELKLTNTLLIVVVCFVSCWAPFAITMFFDVYHPVPIPRFVHSGSLLLGYLNSMCNPIVYGIRTSSFKKGFKNLYANCIPCLVKEDVSSVNSSISDRDSSKVLRGQSYSVKQSFSDKESKPHESKDDTESRPVLNTKVFPALLEVRAFLEDRRLDNIENSKV